MSEFWNKRFDREEFVYGNDPSPFFREQLWDQKFGRLLLPGEGEGRNAVYAAKKGWFVHAFDSSEVAAAKAILFSNSEKVRFEYEVSDVQTFETAENYYHLIGIAFLHLLPDTRKKFHRMMARSLVPGGKLIAEYFEKKQINQGTGGPGNIEMLYNREQLRSDFREMKILQLEEELVELNSGIYHQGEAWVLRIVCEKTD